jgi:hypothetical protein
VLNEVADGDKKVPQYLVLLTEPRDGMDFDFNQARVYTWNVKRHRYETAYRERNLNGSLPTTVTQENFDKEGILPVFVLRVKDGDGNTSERKYKLNTPMVKRVLAPGETGWEKEELGTAVIAGLLQLPFGHVDLRQGRKRLVVVEGFQPPLQRFQQSRDVNTVKLRWVSRQVFHGPHQHRSHTHTISCGVMMKGNRNLHEPLPDFLLFVRGSSPDVFQHLMSVEKLSFIEQRDPVEVFGLVCGHSHRPRRKENLAP